MGQSASYQELLDRFDEIKYRYEVLNDVDVLEAFSIMRDSSSLLASYEAMVADAVKLSADMERNAKATEARISCELSPKPTEGARRAACDQAVIDAWEAYSETVRNQKYAEINAKFLNRVYFDTKMVVENCYRQARPPVGTDRVVGRT